MRPVPPSKCYLATFQIVARLPSKFCSALAIFAWPPCKFVLGHLENCCSAAPYIFLLGHLTFFCSAALQILLGPCNFCSAAFQIFARSPYKFCSATLQLLLGHLTPYKLLLGHLESSARALQFFARPPSKCCSAALQGKTKKNGQLTAYVNRL
jgi:hypothetical protein